MRGAREVSNFTIMLQSDPEVSVPLPYAIHCLPGDVFMLRKTVTGNWRVSNFVARHQTRWVCKLRGRIRRGRRSGIAQVVPINGFAPVEMQMDLADVPAEVDLEKAAFEVEFLPESMKPEPYVEIFVRFVKEIGNRFDPLGEIAIASAEYDLPVEFSAAALDEAQALPDEVDPKNIGRRVDLRDIPFVTIDGEDARDFDDAVYCARVEDGRTRLLVAIADVSHYVKPGAPLDVDAQQRATSVYFPASVVPMLPEKLSNGLCSLNPGVDRLTMVCDAVIDPEGRTEAYQFYPAVIHSHARLTYTQVWGALQGEEGGLAAVGDRLDDIRALYDLFKTLRKARDARHTLDLETKETMAVFDDKGVISEFKVREHNDAHRLIEECMLVANVCAADVIRKSAGRSSAFMTRLVRSVSRRCAPFSGASMRSSSRRRPRASRSSSRARRKMNSCRPPSCARCPVPATHPTTSVTTGCSTRPTPTSRLRFVAIPTCCFIVRSREFSRVASMCRRWSSTTRP